MGMYTSGNTDEAYNWETMREAIEIRGLAYSPGSKLLGMFDASNEKHAQAFNDKMRLDGPWPEKMIRERANATNKMIGMVGSFDNSIHNLFKAGDETVRRALIDSALEASIGVGTLLDSRARVRLGADGVEKQVAKLVGVHCVGVLARETENPLLHVHYNVYPFGVNDKGECRSLDTRPLKINDERYHQVFQNIMAMGIEKRLGLKMEIEPKLGMARVVGVSTERESNRKAMAQEYLKEKGIEESTVAMAYAMRNTRPKKVSVNMDEKMKEWGEKAEKVEPKKVMEHERGLFQKVVEDLLLLPLQVFAVAWKATRDRKQIAVLDVKEFIKDAKPRTLHQRHKAAIKAVRRTDCASFMDALTVAEKAFKALKPKIEVPKNAVIKVKASRIENTEQRKALEKIAKKNGAELRVYGRREEEKVEESQKQKRGM